MSGDSAYGGFPYGKPIRVEGGVKARSTRGDIGTTWWSRRFIDVLESFALGSRLTRGRNYARKGQVLSLSVEPGLVSASVQGSRPKPYQVTVELTPFPGLVWARAEIALAEQAIHSAHLLAGEMPGELEEVFAAAGAPLFPARIGDLSMRCSCPDHQVPCKHLAATFYLLAERFDADPFQILHWRGRTREELLDRLRELRGTGTGAGAEAGPGAGSDGRDGEDGRKGVDGRGGEDGRSGGDGRMAVAAVIGTAVALADLADPADEPERFWFPPVPLPARPRTRDADPDLRRRQLSTPGSELGGPALTEALRPAYERFSHAADPGEP